MTFSAFSPLKPFLVCWIAAVTLSPLLLASTDALAGKPTSARNPIMLLHWHAADKHLGGAAARGAQVLRCDCNVSKCRSRKLSCTANLCGASLVVDGDAVAKAICSAVSKSREFSLLAVVSNARAEQSGPARIVSFSSDTSERNFTLGQDGTAFDLWVLTRNSDGNGSQKDSHFGKVSTDRVIEVLVACRQSTAMCYIDGKLVKKMALAGAIEGWSDRHKIVFGDELTGERDWCGTLHRVAIFDRALKPSEATGLIAGKGGSGKHAQAKKPVVVVEPAQRERRGSGGENKIARSHSEGNALAEEKAAALRREKARVEARTRMMAHDKARAKSAKSAESDKHQAAVLSGLRDDVGSLHDQLDFLRRDGNLLAEQLAASAKHRQRLQKQLAELLEQKKSDPSEVVEVSRQFAAALEQLNRVSQERLLEQQRRVEAQAERFRSESERVRAEVQKMRQHFEKQISELHAALEAAQRAKAEAESAAGAARVKAGNEAVRSCPARKCELAGSDSANGRPWSVSVHGFARNEVIPNSDPGSAWLAVMKVLARHPDAKFEIVGHTSSEGPSQVNACLSRSRARTVRDFLVGHGVPGESLSLRGAGEAEPLADNSSEKGRDRNRRVEILRTK